MNENLLRLTDNDDDPVVELRLATNAIVRAVRRAIEQAVDKGPLGDLARGLLKPRIRVAEDAKTVVVTVEGPGTVEDSLEVTMSPNDMLCIKGRRIEKADGVAARDAGTTQHPRSFERSFPLAGHEIDREKATAHFENGLLTVTIPKLAKAPSTSETTKNGVRAA